MAFGGAPVTVLAEMFSAPLGAKFFSLGSDSSDVNVYIGRNKSATQCDPNVSVEGNNLKGNQLKS